MICNCEVQMHAIQVSVTADTATKILNSNSGRTRAIILSPGFGFRIGSDNTVSNTVGFPITSGTIELTTNGEVWVHTTGHGGPITVNVIEESKV